MGGRNPGFPVPLGRSVPGALAQGFRIAKWAPR